MRSFDTDSKTNTQTDIFYNINLFSGGFICIVMDTLIISRYLRVGEGKVDPSPTFDFIFKKIKVNIFFFGGGGGYNQFFLEAISLGMLVVPSPKIIINLPGPMQSNIVKDNPFGSAVSITLRYRQRKLTKYFI